MSAAAKASMPLEAGEFHILGFPGNGTDEPEAFALVLNMDNHEEFSEPPVVRIHSECLTGESLGSLRCDCGYQLQEALRQIKKEGRGVLVYLRQEGRGIGLMNKIKAYELQDRGVDTMDANLMLGHPADARSFVRGAHILHGLGVERCRLLTNNPDKIHALEKAGIRVDARLPIEKRPDRYSLSYMQTKQTRFGHLYSFAEPGNP
nr:GTP cyclohydrolase II [Salinispira pacifica]